MSSPDQDRWKRIEDLYHEALNLAPGARAAFLDTGCGTDAALRQEVESLLSFEGRGDDLLEAPAAARAASGVPSLVPEVALKPGAMVGPYRVVSHIGAGGMGEVYRAHDTKLRRDIVLKTLPRALADDPAWMSRFRREAQALASLNHPNVATLHGLEESPAGHSVAIVMELIEGQTIAQRLATGGPIPWPEAVATAIQAAEGIGAAHRKGVVHRDLKPANLMVTSAGLVKVLDFGIAKLDAAPGAVETQTLVDQTREGSILGTPAYMAPEQAEGRPVDARSDIFSFGTVLHEMLTGQPAFAGASTAAVLSSVLRDDPAPLPGSVPKSLGRLVARCLNKDSDRRYQSITDVRFALEDLLLEATSPPTSAAPHKRFSLVPGLFALAATIVLVGAGFAWIASRNAGKASAAPIIVSPLNPGNLPAVSPDGKMIAFVWAGEDGDNRDIYVRAGAGPALQLTHDPAMDLNPVWSPDGRQIAFSRLGDADFVSARTLIVPMLGGAERSVAPGMVQDWSPDGNTLLVIAAAPGEPRSFRLVNVGDGASRPLTATPLSGRPGSARFSPDGKTVYFVLIDAPGQPRMLRVTTSGQGTPEPVGIRGVRGILNFALLPGGQEFLLAAVPEESIIPSLWRVPVAGGIATPVPFGRNVTSVAVSANSNVIAFALSSFTESIHRIAAWPGSDRQPRPWAAGEYSSSSPAFLAGDPPRIAFASDRSGSWQIWAALADGIDPLPLTRFRPGAVGIVGSPAWSPDGAEVVFDARTSNADIWVVPARGNGEPRQITSDPAADMTPAWSPDGKWIYFTSDRNGGRQFIWRTRPVTGSGPPEQVTTNGGYGPKFSPDGKYLYYLKNRREGEIWRMPVEGGQPAELVLKDFRGRDFEVLKEGIYLLDRGTGADEYALRRARAKFYRFRTRKVEDLNFETAAIASPYGITVSADEKWLYYAEHGRANIDVMLVENFR